MILSALSTKIPGGSLTRPLIIQPEDNPGQWLVGPTVPGGLMEGRALLPLTTGARAGGAILFGGCSGRSAGFDYVGAYCSFGGPAATNVGTYLYNHTLNSWVAGGALDVARVNFAACVLVDGRILVSGGCTADAFPAPIVATAAIYDPVANAWAATGSMVRARAAHTLTLLADGKVLATGGRCTSGATSESEIFNPATSTWGTVAAMPSLGGVVADRVNHEAFLLPNSKVILVSGHESTGTPNYGRTMLYDVATNTWSYGATLPTPVACAGVAKLSNGNIIAVGGVPGEDIQGLPGGGYAVQPGVLVSRIYDYEAGTWSIGSPLRSDLPTTDEPWCFFPMIVTLADGLTLRAWDHNGDVNGVGTVGSRSWLYNPSTDRWGPNFLTASDEVGLTNEGEGRMGRAFCRIASGQVVVVDRYGEYTNRYVPPS